jgi:hypothetical protein
VSTEEALERQRRRGLCWWIDKRIGMVRLSGRLPDVDGPTVITALQRLHASSLAMVCPTHHRFVHERGWHVRGDPSRPDGLQFRRPDGHTYTIKGPPLDPNVRARVPRVPSAASMAST